MSLIGNDSGGITETKVLPGVPGVAVPDVAPIVPSDTSTLDEEQARRTPRPTELPDHPAP